MECKNCGNDIRPIEIIQKNGKIYKAAYFSKKPYEFNGVKYYRKICEDCIFKKIGRKPRKPNIVNKDYIDILEFDEDTTELFLDYLDERFGITEEKMLKRYGEVEGKIRWDSYREKQAYSNSLEYKKEKYGMTKEEFDDFNKSRSVTEENCIKRHGKEKGLKIWNDYVEKQRINGCTLEWFIEKYGKEDGSIFYKELNKKKACSLENFINKYGEEEGTDIYNKKSTSLDGCILKYGEEEGTKRYEELNKKRGATLSVFINKYGEEEGTKKYENFLQKTSHLYYSKMSQDLFWSVYKEIQNDFQKIFFAELNKEYYFFDNDKETIYLFDFLVYDNKKVIEFNGDYWHANKDTYNENDLINYPNNVQMYAKEVWEKDRVKFDFLKSEGFDLLVVWEKEFKNDIEKTIKKCVEFLND